MFCVKVILETSDEVVALRGRVAALEAALEDAKAQLNAVEYRYRCECIVNMELTDLCRANGIRYRASMEGRPKGAI